MKYLDLSTSSQSHAFPAAPTRTSFIVPYRWSSLMANLVTDSTFAAEVLAASEPVLVDFWAEWCGPCKAMDPILEDLSRELAGKVKIVKLNVEENVDIVTRYNVRAMPTMIVFKGGVPVDARVGAGQSRVQLTKWLDQFAA
jgi:thioredoxin 1